MAKIYRSTFLDSSPEGNETNLTRRCAIGDGFINTGQQGRYDMFQFRSLWYPYRGHTVKILSWLSLSKAAAFITKYDVLNSIVLMLYCCELYNRGLPNNAKELEEEQKSTTNRRRHESTSSVDAHQSRFHYIGPALPSCDEKYRTVTSGSSPTRRLQLL